MPGTISTLVLLWMALLFDWSDNGGRSGCSAFVMLRIPFPPLHNHQKQPRLSTPPRISTGRLASQLDDERQLDTLLSNSDETSRSSSANILQDDNTGDVHLPKTGVSVSDELEFGLIDTFQTTLHNVTNGVAMLVTEPTHTVSVNEPLRYLVALDPPRNDTTQTTVDYALVDVPPFSPQLWHSMQQFMGPNGRLKVLLLTNRHSIHTDTANGVYSTTTHPHLQAWLRACPKLYAVGYRLDVPRDVRFGLSQILDGYGPFAYNGTTFVETGRPLQVVEWDHATAQDAMNGKLPDDDNDDSDEHDNQKYTLERTRQNEDDKGILAVYTPGYTYGSLSFVFPHTGVCCCGHTVPVEDTRYNENGDTTAGPFLDCRGYITTSMDGKRQMESARRLVEQYADRFDWVLPARGGPWHIDDNDDKSEQLLGVIQQFESIIAVYQKLGITAEE